MVTHRREMLLELLRYELPSQEVALQATGIVERVLIPSLVQDELERLFRKSEVLACTHGPHSRETLVGVLRC